MDLQADGYAAYRVTVDVVCGQVEVLLPQLYDNVAPVLDVEPVPQTVAPDDGLKVTATSSDNDAVASMALYVDGRLIYQLERDRLRHNLDTRSLATGPHVLRILAPDVVGNVQETTIAFSVTPDTGGQRGDDSSHRQRRTRSDQPPIGTVTAARLPLCRRPRWARRLPTSTPAPTAAARGGGL